MTYTPPRAGQRTTTSLLEGMVGEWTDYTPEWRAATTNPSLGNGVLTGRYCVIGDTVHVAIKLTMGSTTTYGAGAYRWTLPVTAASGSDMIGAVFIGDSGSGYSTGIAYVAASDDEAAAYVGAPGAGVAVNPTSPQTFASGDRIWITATYEGA